MLLDQVWQFAHGRLGEGTVIEHVHLLRRKVESTGHPRLIHTVRGVGYVLRETPP